MKILEELWYGNIAPWEKGFKDRGEYSELLRLVIRRKDELRKQLNDEKKRYLRNLLSVITRCMTLQSEKRLCKGLLLVSGLLSK